MDKTDKDLYPHGAYILVDGDRKQAVHMKRKENSMLEDNKCYEKKKRKSRSG